MASPGKGSAGASKKEEAPEKAGSKKEKKEDKAADKEDDGADLPKGWKMKKDRKTGKVYYANTVTRTTSWKRPTKPADADAGSSSSGSDS